MPKSEEELRKEQEEAKKQLDQMFAQSRPKNLPEGLGKGVSNIVGGAVGGAGIAVLAPTAGLAMGLQNGGLIGGVFGVAGGAVVGVLGAAAIVVSGTVTGVTQIIRGVAAVPSSITAPRQGKWWNEASHKWIATDLPKEIAEVPANDDDLLKHLEDELDAAGKKSEGAGGEVKETFYYDVLEVDPKAEAGAIKRQYYKLARVYHPDKCPGDEAAANKFKDVAEAYQVLSDPTLRAKYDTEGKDALSGDKTSVDGSGQPDPSLLLAFLFGSDRFNDYYGRLATSTSAMLGDSPKLSMEQARTLQERRCTRLAAKLAAKIQPWVAEDFEACKVMWQTEAEDLCTANYGWELVQLLGMAYEVSAEQFLGSMDSGIGLPSIGKWATGQKAKSKRSRAAQKNQMEMLMATMDAMKVQAEFQKKMAEAKNDGEKMKLQKEMEVASQNTMLKIIWSTTAVDITATIHETCQMVFFDQSVDKDCHKRRAHAVKNLGQIFQACPEPPVPEGGKKDARTLFEEAALEATVETMKRKDESQYNASFRK
ncbi:protein DnaJ [Seminavis robusta]|uniref:Protein DnaJ n=1 Tax=Seminavis robusta TaxID=568900 RepID=A0A9N8HXE1_9STRA|nr:protein DnaJ [Seminavis robusta]|eukprot:Sro2429_g327390.1 protein DnaJ (537) ;mRNA; f:3092-5153